MNLQHNQIYWRNEAYLGIGVSAASYVDGERNVNEESVDRYIHRAMAEGGAVATRERLDPAARSREALMLELRLRRGVDRAEFTARWGAEALEASSAALERYLCEGLMEQLANGRYRISRRGLPVADAILTDFV